MNGPLFSSFNGIMYNKLEFKNNISTEISFTVNFQVYFSDVLKRTEGSPLVVWLECG